MARTLVRTISALLAAGSIALAPTAATLVAPTHARPAPTLPGTAAWVRAGLPSPAESPAAIHRYFVGLSPARQRQLITRYPSVVGNLDGVPLAARYAANRRAMAATGYRWTGNYLEFIRQDGWIGQVFGDLATARRVAVVVPGVDSRLDTYRHGVGDKPYRALSTQAGNLYRAANARLPGQVAVIAWLGYTTPRGVGVDAAREDLASAGATALTRFVRGLVVDCPHATVSVLGHSYGSVVVGLAARHLPHQVRDIAVFGSPGMGVDRASDLGTRARVWAALAPGDWIGWVPGIRVLGLGHDTLPSDSSFGARPFSTRGVPDHDHYLSPGTGSLAALAAIVTGTEARS